MVCHRVQSLPSVRAVLIAAGARFSAATFPERAVVFRQGDPCDMVSVINDGSVRLSVTSPDGREAICGLMGAGSFLSEEVLSGITVQRHTAIATSPTEVLHIAAGLMLELLHTHQAIQDHFLRHVLIRQSRLEDDLADQLLHSSEQRLARALVLLAGCDSTRPGRCALPHVSQEVIAEMVGTTRTRVNILMNRFKKEGLLDAEHGVIHVQPALLRAIESDRRERPRVRAAVSK
jgi:CRP/FNR family transcriptional regulator, cyclic AMP receptor protein